MNMIENSIFLLFVLNSFQLFSMDVELYKKSDKIDGLKNAIFFCTTMQGYGDEAYIRIPKDVAVVIAQQSYLLRKKEVYEKFDSFFRFNTDGYHKMRSDISKRKNEMFDLLKKKSELHPLSDHSQMLKFGFDMQRLQSSFDNCYLICRQFDIIQPDDLVFFTQKQDEILSSLIFRPKCFYNDKGYFSLQLNAQENEKYVMLPSEFKQKIEKYPKFVLSNNSYKISLSDEIMEIEERF